MKIEDLKPLEDNPFKISGDKQIEAIGKSIESFKEMMSIRKIIIDENNEILGGNKRYFALKMLDYKEIPDEWVHKVTGLSDEKKKEFVVKDNSHWGSEWDFDILEKWEVNLSDYGVAFNDPSEGLISDVGDGLQEVYTNKIESPVYIPNEEKPNVLTLFDDTKTKAFIELIEKSNISEHDKLFLKSAAQRFIVFDYKKIADYYAGSGKEVQEMMESLALIIIDFNKAIESGFLRLSEDLISKYKGATDDQR